MGNVDSKESQNDTSSDLIDKTLSILQGFYIEFFGMFMPGVVAVGCVGALFGGLSYFVSGGCWEVVHGAIRPLAWCPKLAMLFFIFVAYMVGAIVYRREPKGPDAVSSMRQWLRTNDVEKPRLAVQFVDNEKWRPRCICEWVRSLVNYSGWIRNKASGNKVDIDFPYPCLRKFLMSRHLIDLAQYVSWCRGAPQEQEEWFGKEACSKHFINTIKHCVRISGRSSLISDMTRNECHIRMLCSFWYILTFILWATAICLFVGCLIRCVCDRDGFFEMSTLMYLSIHSVGFFLVWYCRRNIEKGLHYVRTREVVMILESANILETVNPELYCKLFASIRTAANKFKKAVCDQCNNPLCREALKDLNAKMKAENGDESSTEQSEQKSLQRVGEAQEKIGGTS